MDPGKHDKVSYVIGVENKQFFFTSTDVINF